MSGLTPEQKFRRAKELQAFPVNVYEGKWNDGMTLRDYFAAQAMQSLIEDEHDCSDWLSSRAYEYADAMLKARDAE